MIYVSLKRLLDIVVSALAIVGLSPLLAVVSILVYFDSAGPVLYRGRRTGLDAVEFDIFKFRTMVPNAESIGGPSTALDDARLTRIGPVLRKYKIDETPQFLNVLLGSMSLVGPRPQVAHYTRLYVGDERKILSVKPGLTDYASIYFSDMDDVLGRDDVDTKYLTEVEPVKNKLRLKYVHERSFLVDLKIIGWTVLLLFGVKCNEF